MKKACVACKKSYYEDVEECVFCFSKLEHCSPPENLRVRSYTQVNTPSLNHKETPYYCLLVEDSEGDLFLTKSMLLPEKGQAVNLKEDNLKLDLHIGVIGTGIMGRGITQLLLRKGASVTLVSRSNERLKQVQEQISKHLSTFVSLGEKEGLLRNLTLTTAIADLADVDIVIESIKEDLALKRNILEKLNEVCSKETVIATNTSCLSVTELAELVTDPSRVAGLHFSNPVEKMLLAEIVKTKYTSQSTIVLLRGLAERLGKKPTIADDTPGFIANRIFVPYLLEAVYLFEQGVDKKTIDDSVKFGYNHPLGPLQVIDLMGVDTFYDIVYYLHRSTGNEKFKMPRIIEEMMTKKILGRKTGEGFYTYSKK